MKNAGGVGGVLAIGAGAFLILLAYTGKLQEVWGAAFGGPLNVFESWTNPGFNEVGDTPGSGVERQPNAVENGNCAAYVLAGNDAVGPTCENGKCPPGMTTVYERSNKACTTNEKLGAARAIGWSLIPTGGGGGEAITPGVMGGWQRVTTASASPAGSWGFAS